MKVRNLAIILWLAGTGCIHNPEFLNFKNPKMLPLVYHWADFYLDVHSQAYPHTYVKFGSDCCCHYS